MLPHGLRAFKLGARHRILERAGARENPPEAHARRSEKPMPQLFAVIRTRGPAWQPSRPLEGQVDWAAHAAFMNGLVRDGAVILGGPLEGTADVLLVMRAETADDARGCLAADPWTVQDLLRVVRISPWTLRLGSLV
jgi:uncharacterized protein YciI